MELESLLGLPPRLEGNEAERIRRALTETWTITVGAVPGDLQADLVTCRRWFDPVAQGQRLRRELSELKGLPSHLSDPGPPLTFPVSEDKRLVTPEGRCALELLEKSPRGVPLLVTDAETLRFERILGHLYADWSRHRLKSVVRLLTGTDKPLQIPAAGVVTALLVNRCTSEDRALTRFASGEARDVIDAAFFAPVEAFADILAPSRRGNKNDPHLVSGWPLYEARRRLGDGLVVVDARGGIDGKVWIRSERETEVVDKVARDLARGHRSRVTVTLLATAFDALVQGLRQELPNLAAFGLVHERPHETALLRERLLAIFARHLESG